MRPQRSGRRLSRIFGPRKAGRMLTKARPGLEALEGRALLASRLFALPLGDTSVITELNPATGAEVRRFPAPAPSASSGENGLAFDGNRLYYMPFDNSGRLWELNPDTGNVVRSTVVALPDNRIDGLGAVGGKLYLQDDLNHALYVVDPVTETMVGQLDVGANLVGGLTGADGPDELIATVGLNSAVRIDPNTGAVLGGWALPDGTLGVAFVGGNLYFGSAQTDQILVTDRSGQPLQFLTTPYPVSALGGDGEAPAAPSTGLVANGDFELGSLQGWTRYSEPGSNGPGFEVYQGANPFNSPLGAPPQGRYAAGNSQNGPATDVLYQDVTLPADASAQLSLTVAYVNRANGFAVPTPDTLDYHAFPNQQFRVDVVSPAADPLSTQPGDVLLTVFQTKVGDPNAIQPTLVTADLSAFAGRTVRLRIAVVDNLNYFNAAVDAVSIQTTPTPPPPLAYYVADPLGYDGAPGEIVMVDAQTEQQTVIASGGPLVNPYGIAVAPDGSLIVADHGTFGPGGAILRVDPATGQATVISADGVLVDPSGVAFAPNGDLLIADFGSGGGAKVVRVDPATGRQTVLTQGGYLQGPFSVTTAPDGTIYLADFGFPGGASGSILRVDPVSGQQFLVSTGVSFVDPSGILVAPDGSLIVSDSGGPNIPGAIFRVDPRTGQQSLITVGGLLQEPVGIAFAPDGSLVVADADAAGGPGALIRVNLTTGAQTFISTGGHFDNPLGVAVGPLATPASGQPPVASAGGPYSVEEGGAVPLDATGTVDPDQDPSTLTYVWDLNGDGIFGETGAAATNGDEVGARPVFLAAGLPGGAVSTVDLRVTDAQGHTSTATAVVTVENRPPVVSLDATATVDAGTPLTLHGSFADPGAGESFNASVDYGDGDGDGLQVLTLNPDRTFDLSHVYKRSGAYNVVVYVSDGNGGLGAASVNVSVNAIRPVFDRLDGASITYGQGAVTLGGHLTGALGTPSGDVEITLAGVRQVVTVDPSTGDFSAVFSTATLGVQGSPYVIKYAYDGDATYTFLSDTTRSVTVTPRALTVTAADASKVYGQPDPAFTAGFDGFVNGEGPADLSGTLAFATNEGSPLTAPVGTYTVTPSGLASPNYAIAFVPGTLTVKQATTTLTASASPTVVIGTPATTLSGKVGSDSVLPAGQTVTVTVLGAGGPVATASGTVGTDGAFAVTLNTSALPAGAYTVRYAYAGDANFTAGSAAGTLTVTYAVQYDPVGPKRAGSADPIKLTVVDAAGRNLASPDLVVTALQIVDATGRVFTPSAKGSNPGNTFRRTGSTYAYNLDTTGLAPGKYTLYVAVGNDPVKHALTFTVS